MTAAQAVLSDNMHLGIKRLQKTLLRREQNGLHTDTLQQNASKASDEIVIRFYL